MENAKAQPAYFRFIKAVSDVTEKFAGYLCGTLVMIMFAIVILQVFARTVGTTISWTEEATRYLLIWVGMLGAGIALKEGGHAAIGFVVERFPKRVQIAINILVESGILVFMVIFLKTSFKAALASNAILASSFEMTMLIPKLALPVGSVLLIVNCLYLIAFDVVRFGAAGKGGSES